VIEKELLEQYRDIVREGAATPMVACTIMLTKALVELTNEVRKIGNGNAVTDKGAIEALGMHLGVKIDELKTVVAIHGDQEV
jgi:formiminotetrahydrofolate cyclodeaminase